MSILDCKRCGRPFGYATNAEHCDDCKQYLALEAERDALRLRVKELEGAIALSKTMVAFVNPLLFELDEETGGTLGQAEYLAVLQNARASVSDAKRAIAAALKENPNG